MRPRDTLEARLKSSYTIEVQKPRALVPHNRFCTVGRPHMFWPERGANIQFESCQAPLIPPDSDLTLTENSVSIRPPLYLLVLCLFQCDLQRAQSLQTAIRECALPCLQSVHRSGSVCSLLDQRMPLTCAHPYLAATCLLCDCERRRECGLWYRCMRGGSCCPMSHSALPR
jgi:hypothetical protein|eukprot:7379628-Prymnesium_polylepis.1